MEKFTELVGLVAPLDRANVDTDAIIPSQFLKSVKRTGFGANLFDGWRYRERGEPGRNNSGRTAIPDFVLNLPRYRGAQVLLARENFGCGSSREHAAWALLDYGFRAVIAPSFADIFVANSFKNGLLLVVLDAALVDKLFRVVETTPDYRLKVDLRGQTVTTPEGQSIPFHIDEFNKSRLESGLDDIDLVLRHADKIKAYEDERRNMEPWTFASL
jgi:3-isopropylmalate/(R)-2-methylmalate dehydratase small subunit